MLHDGLILPYLHTGFDAVPLTIHRSFAVDLVRAATRWSRRVDVKDEAVVLAHQQHSWQHAICKHSCVREGWLCLPLDE